MTDRLHRGKQRLAQPNGCIAIVLQKVKRDALRRTRPDAGQLLQGIHQPVERRAEFQLER